MPFAPKCLCTPDALISENPNPECPQHGEHGLEDPKARIAATVPLILNAIYFIERSKKLRHLVEGDPHFYQAILEAHIELRYAIDSIEGALSLLAPLATIRSDRLQEIRTALVPVQTLGSYLHGSPEDTILNAAFWMIFDRLVLPQIDRLWGSMEPVSE